MGRNSRERWAGLRPRSRRARLLCAALAAVVVAAGAAVLVRALAPPDYHERFAGPYGGYPVAPAASGDAGPRVVAQVAGRVQLQDGLALLGAGNRIPAGRRHRPVAVGDDTVATMNLRTRSLFWSYRRPGSSVVRAALQGRDTAVLWSDGLLTDLNTRTGRARWHRKLPMKPPGGTRLPRPAAGTQFVVTDRTLTAVDTRTGAVRRTVRAPGPCQFLPTDGTYTSRILAVALRAREGADEDDCPDQVRGYAPDTGRLRWHHATTEDAYSLGVVAVDDRTVASGAVDVVEWDASTGRRLRTFDAPDTAYGAGGGLLLAKPARDRSRFEAVDAVTGKRLWRRRIPNDEDAAVPSYLDSGRVCTAVRIGGSVTKMFRLRLDCYRPRSGRPVSRTPLPVRVPPEVALDEDEVKTFRRGAESYVSASTRQLTAVSTAEGWAGWLSEPERDQGTSTVIVRR